MKPHEIPLPPMTAEAFRRQFAPRREFGPLFKRPEHVLRCLGRYVREENHSFLVGCTVEGAARYFCSDHYAASCEEIDAVCAALELGLGKDPIP